MENIKLQYLKCLLYRTRTTELECLVEAIDRVEQDCRDCYAEVVDLSRNKFIEIMVIDGFFILEFLCRYHEKRRWVIQGEDDDPVFKTSWMPRKIVADHLLLLEINYQFPPVEHKHLLDFFRAQLVESCTIELPALRFVDSWKGILVWKPISSVTELLDFEVGFFPAPDGDSILDVKLEVGKMKIPKIFVEENT